MNENKLAHVIPVVISGGLGSRLWPLSRENFPKPFIQLADGQSLIEKTYRRALAVSDLQAMVTVTNRELYFATRDEYEKCDAVALSHAYILEPFARNTAAAIVCAAHHIAKTYSPESIMLVLPADHLITGPEAFSEAVKEAVALAIETKLVTFGVQPNSPHTGYGYIEFKENHVIRFIEKPSEAKAIEFIATGNFLWNSGMFCFSAGTLLKEALLCAPELYHKTQLSMHLSKAFQEGHNTCVEIKPEYFEAVENISIDYGIFERSKNVAVVPTEIQWSDLGSWTELSKLHPKDEAGNYIQGETALEDVKNCMIYSKNRVIAGIGLKNLLIADTDDALLIAELDRVQEVRKIVSQLQARDHEVVKSFSTVQHPWGNYTVLHEGRHYKIKQIEVKPGGALSLQKHEHRSEHWLVVSGTAFVMRDEHQFKLEQDQYFFIGAKQVHRLENRGVTKLVIIEVQMGESLGEEDTKRFDDVSGRAVETEIALV